MASLPLVVLRAEYAARRAKTSSGFGRQAQGSVEPLFRRTLQPVRIAAGDAPAGAEREARIVAVAPGQARLVQVSVLDHDKERILGQQDRLADDQRPALGEIADLALQAEGRGRVAEPAGEQHLAPRP